MAIVAGVDFGTLSVRVSIVERERGVLSTALSEYPLHRKREDPEFATQSHDDQMRALAAATREAVQEAGISGEQVQALAMDTTCSSVIPVGKNLEPLDGYYLWCDHRAKKEAAEITEAAIAKGLPPFSGAAECIRPRGGFSKLLHWLRHNPEKRAQFVSAFEHCDMAVATLCGITDPRKVKRSVCAMAINGSGTRIWAACHRRNFSSKSIQRFAGVREKLQGEYATSDQTAGKLTGSWAQKLVLKTGILIPVGAFDAHWDAIGAGCRTEDT
jgi:L-ribulokinase